MKKILRIQIFLALALLQISFFCFGQYEGIKVTDMLKIKSLSAIDLNNQGTKAVFMLTSIEPDGDAKWEYKYVNQLWMVNTTGNPTPQQLTTKENSSQPSFSPDGRQIAFVRTVNGKSQVFILSLEGGEAVQLTSFKYGASNPRWSPDGKQILFSSNIPFRDLLKDSVLNARNEIPDWPFEKPGISNKVLFGKPGKPDPDGNLEEVRAYLDNNAQDKKAHVITKLNFQDESDVNPDLNFNHYFILAPEQTIFIPVKSNFSNS